ncbi:hypothetical protein DMV94_07210 [Vibrio parahaemolyticus]|nr:hypothetical protein [Vibrio parahaemolyticus]EGR3040256.1 hypothetical protein [Vibrio parahaemolyticus]
MDISLKHSALGTFYSLATNAALRGEQRELPNLNHCAVNTKVSSNQTAKRCESLLNALLVAKPKALT